MFRLLASALLVLLFCLPLLAAEADSNLFLTLENGVTTSATGRTALEIEVRVRDGAWGAGVCATTIDFLRNHISGVVREHTVADGVHALAVDLTFDDDPYFKGGTGAYRLTVREQAGAWIGQYTGTYNGQPVAGAVTGRREDVWPGRVAGHVPLKAGEHPRLIFRKSDLTLMRDRAANTPEGQAMMAQFLAVLDKGAPQERLDPFPAGAVADGEDGDDATSDKFTSWPAVGYGFAWQMTGEARHAQRAREVIEQSFFANPAGRQGKGVGQDIHHGPRLQGLALAYDLCYDAWDEAFRRKCGEEIARRVVELYTGKFGGKVMGGTNPVWWANHNGIRVACAGLGALALLDEVGPDGKPLLPDARRYIDYAERASRGWLDLAQGGAADAVEGDFYHIMTLRRGFAAFLVATEAALGEKIDAGPRGDYLVAGIFMRGAPGEVFPFKDWDLVPRETVWTSSLASVPPHLMPGMRYLIDQAVGLQGDKTFGITYAMLAPYVLRFYPFGVPARRPDEVFPWSVADAIHGHCVFRPRFGFREANDILLELNLNSLPLRSCHNERMGPLMGLTLRGLGATWLEGPALMRAYGMLEMTQNVGPTITRVHEFGPRTTVLDLDAGRAYALDAPRGDLAEAVQRLGGVGSFEVPLWGTMVDRGVRAQRSIAVDASGACGSPLLIAIADHIGFAPEAKNPAQRFGFALPVPGGMPKRVAGNRFQVGEPGGPTLAGIFAGGTPSPLAPAISTSGESLIVMTLQPGPAPTFTVVGEGLGARVTVGGRTVRVVDGSLVLE